MKSGEIRKWHLRNMKTIFSDSRQVLLIIDWLHNFVFTSSHLRGNCSISTQDKTFTDDITTIR